MSEPGRLYLNVTTSWLWRRPPAGVIRVERELARYFRTSRVEARYCILDESRRNFTELNRAETDALLADDWCAIPDSPVAPDPPSASGKMRGLLRRLARRVPLAGAIYRRIRRRGAGQGRAGDAVSEGASERSPRATVSPSARDVFISVGLDWEYGLEPVLDLKRRSGVTVVLGCHDTIPVDFPELSSKARPEMFQEYFLQVAQVADKILAVSETTKESLGRFYQRSGVSRWPAIVAVPLGCHEPAGFRDRGAVHLAPDFRAQLESLTSGQGFVLYVSTVEARKNHRMLVQIWQDLYRQSGADIPVLVFVGMMGWGVDDLVDQLRRSEVYRQGRIVMLDRVSDDELAALYRACLFSVFPSVCEGWGLGAVETMSYGKVCIVSSAPALREATHGLCPSLHPLDFLGWRDAVVLYWRDAGLRQAAESRVREAFVLRTWEAFGRDVEARLCNV